MITVGFTLIGRGNWSGGETYLRNMLGVMRDLLPGKVQAKLFLSPEQYSNLGESFTPFLACPPIIHAAVRGAGEGKRAIEAILFGRDRPLGDLVSQHKIDVFFESAQWFGNGFACPVVSWIPDFQHRRLPHLFPKSAWWKRDIGFRVQTMGRRTIMLSSRDSEEDCLTFYPASVGKTSVVKFAIDLDPAAVSARCEATRLPHGLPERYIYLPNQFWNHKNHAQVIEALKICKARGVLAQVLPIILTGRKEDPRDPTLFTRLMADVADHDLSAHFRHLGLIPYEDVFALNAGANALLNPSRFEGWSTPVEEAKALGTPMILSDIPLHREQAPEATFFGLDNPVQLAEVMVRLAQDGKLIRQNLDVLVSQHAQRREDYAAALLATFETALSL